MAFDLIRLKRRLSGDPGPPSALGNGEVAVNEVDGGLYYGSGVASDGVTATAVVRLNPALPTLAPVAATGAYADLAGKPVIPTLPVLATVATSGAYADLTGKPAISAAPSLATASAIGLVKPDGITTMVASDGTMTVPTQAPTLLSGPMAPADQLVMVRGTDTYYVTQAEVQAWAAGGGTPTPSPAPTPTPTPSPTPTPAYTFAMLQSSNGNAYASADFYVQNAAGTAYYSPTNLPSPGWSVSIGWSKSTTVPPATGSVGYQTAQFTGVGNPTSYHGETGPYTLSNAGTGTYYPWAITSDGVAFCFVNNPHPAN